VRVSFAFVLNFSGLVREAHQIPQEERWTLHVHS
jgi:hypothetical protein